MSDAAFVCALSPGPSQAARRRWLQQYKLLEAQGIEFDFVVVQNGRDRGLVRMHDFAEIDDESSFRWGNFIALEAGLLTPTALTIYSLGFDTLGFARAHMAVPNANQELVAFHLKTGAELEYDDGTHSYFRFGGDTYDRVRNGALQRRVVTVSERA